MRLELTLVGLIAMIVLVRIFIPVDTVTGMASSDEGEIDEGIKQVLMEYFIDYDSLQAQLEQRQEQIDLVQQVGARQGLPDTFYPAHLFIISNGLYEQTTCSQVAELFWIEECQGLPKDECEAEMHCTACEEGGCGCSLFKNYPLTYHAVSCNFGMGQVSFKDAYNLGYSGPVEGLEDTETNLRMYFLTMKRLNEDARTQTIIDRIIAHDIGLERLTQIKETYGETFEEYYIALPFPKRYAILAGKVLTIASVLQEPTNDDLEEHIENALSRLSIPPVEQISSVRMSSLPRFRIDEDYALSQMSQMKEDAKNLISTCKGEERVEQCVQDNLPKDWQTGSTCATVFDKAIAYIDQCASAINPPCNCFYDSIKQDETITFTNTDGGIRVAVGREASTLAGVRLEEPSIVFNEDTMDWLSLPIIGDDQKFIGNLGSGKIGFVDKGTSGCKYPDTKIVRFCADTGQTITHVAGSEIREEQLIYRFALDFRDVQEGPYTFGETVPTDGHALVITKIVTQQDQLNAVTGVAGQ